MEHLDGIIIAILLIETAVYFFYVLPEKRKYELAANHRSLKIIEFNILTPGEKIPNSRKNRWTAKVELYGLKRPAFVLVQSRKWLSVVQLISTIESIRISSVDHGGIDESYSSPTLFFHKKYTTLLAEVWFCKFDPKNMDSSDIELKGML